MYENKQAVFDQIADHLARQKKHAMNANRDICVLRTTDGLKCAVGCLIADSDYRETFDTDEDDAGLGAHVSGESLTGPFGAWFRANVDPALFSLLVGFQAIHDDSNEPEQDWPPLIFSLARSELLTFDDEDFLRKLQDPAYTLATV